MSIDHEIARSRRLVARWWPVIAERCPDPRLAGASLQPVEGMSGQRSQDLDMRAHIDYFAVTPGRWTPVSTRFQSAEFAAHRTATFRRTEVEHLRHAYSDPQALAADLHVQMYGDDTSLLFVIVAALQPVAQYFAETALDGHHWLYAPDGRRFLALGRGVRNGHGTLRALGALVWECSPGEPEQMGLLA